MKLYEKAVFVGFGELESKGGHVSLVRCQDAIA